MREDELPQGMGISVERPQPDLSQKSDKNPEHEKFGRTITGSRWFNGNPFVIVRSVTPVEENWACPIAGCTEGIMVYNGMQWPVNPPGYHHTCSKCGFTAAVHEKYPRVVYR